VRVALTMNRSIGAIAEKRHQQRPRHGKTHGISGSVFFLWKNWAHVFVLFLCPRAARRSAAPHMCENRGQPTSPRASGPLPLPAPALTTAPHPPPRTPAAQIFVSPALILAVRPRSTLFVGAEGAGFYDGTNWNAISRTSPAARPTSRAEKRLAWMYL
jgi:hypothetical protein